MPGSSDSIDSVGDPKLIRSGDIEIRLASSVFDAYRGGTNVIWGWAVIVRLRGRISGALRPSREFESCIMDGFTEHSSACLKLHWFLHFDSAQIEFFWPNRA